jgi:hypothetical protein
MANGNDAGRAHTHANGNDARTRPHSYTAAADHDADTARG